MPDDDIDDHQKFWEIILQRYCKRAVLDLKRDYPHSKSLYINYHDVERSGKTGLLIADEIINNPGKAIEDCLVAVETLRLFTDQRGQPAKDIVPRFEGLISRTAIKALRERHINKMLAIEVQVKRVSDILPRLTTGVFRCNRGHFTTKRQQFMKFISPDACGTEGCTVKTFDLIPKRSTFVDTQRILVQEIVDNLHGGEQPLTMSAEVTGDLVGKVFPGDRVIINAILRSYQRASLGVPSPVFKTFLEVNNIEIFEREYEEVTITEEDEKAIIALAHTPNVLQNVSNSIIPFIYGMDDVKQAIALSMFSARQVIKEGNIKRRDIHVLVVTDPSMAKSKIGRAAVRVVPRGIYVSCEAASDVGLTVSVTRDENDKRWVAEAGAMCLADGGLIVLDELGRLSKRNQSALLETMENQTTSIAKAGIVGSFHTRCATIGLMNPKMGRFDPQGDLEDQLDMNPALLTRFDFIFIKMDNPEVVKDAAVADKILEDDDVPDHELHPGLIPLELMRKFIAYAKKQPNPKISPEAKTILKSHYVEVRAMSQPNKPMPITTRALESSIRIAIAHAKMRLSDTVTALDAELAVTVLDACLKKVATDSQTGLVDMDKLGGVSKRKRDLATHILETIRALNEKQGPCRVHEILDLMKQQGIQFYDSDVDSTIEKLKRENLIMEPRTGVYRAM